MLKKIMVIDDNVDYAEAIKTILESADYEVRIANSSDQAIRTLEAEVPDLIILDIMMQKGAEGIMLSRKFKKDPRLQNVPILMLTSITQQTGFTFTEEDPRHDKYLPVDLFVEKPIHPRVLLEKVKALVSAERC
jgi:twitching motility two-component system response regulator PilH